MRDTRSELLSLPSENRIGVFSRGILSIPFLETMLDNRICLAGGSLQNRVSAIAGWGRKPTATKARKYAEKHDLPYIALEDGFLRSWGTGDLFPPLSVVIDPEGIYYDSTGPSALESLLNGDADILEGIEDDVHHALALILEHRLSKYNHAPEFSAVMLREHDRKRVLVIDQTVGDMSISLGLAGEHSFAEMLTAAREENPDATIYVKTHPEVIAGRKQGHFFHVGNDERTVVIREAVNPIGLIGEMDRVYAVSSTMGFEALLAGKPVSCFGMPWYAGWGVTDDRKSCSRRTRRRSVEELFAAAYFRYARYLDPVTYLQGSIFAVIDWLVLQRSMMERYPGKMICQGFRQWKAANIKPMLSLHGDRVHFVPDTPKTGALLPDSRDLLVVWGRTVPDDLADLAAQTGSKVLRMEDGFVRSVGLGSDLISPLSLVLDERGLYFDPSGPSDLEHILCHASFTPDEIAEAEAVRRFIVEHAITKYNIERREPPNWPVAGKRVVLVPGQVEDDASIRFGCRYVASNLDLLRAARASRPDAFIVFKPHPDVTSGNRKGRVTEAEVRQFADAVALNISAISCIDAADEVHTMTSLTGFDALLRNKHVVTYGEPFYAGWGLTEDMAPDTISFKRRQRQLTLDEMVAGALLRYPLYWDPSLKGYTSCLAVLRRIKEQRNLMEATGEFEKLRAGYVRRQFRKLSILLNTTVTRL
jgi:capsular polysaccharide export protein